jgi:hypothetical protein
MPDNEGAEYQQRMLGYPCGFTRSLDEATASLIRVLTEEGYGFSEGPTVWLGRIEGWLGDAEQPLAGLNFGGAEFNDSEWRIILSRVAMSLRRHLTKA